MNCTLLSQETWFTYQNVYLLKCFLMVYSSPFFKSRDILIFMCSKISHLAIQCDVLMHLFFFLFFFYFFLFFFFARGMNGMKLAIDFCLQ